MHPKSILQFWFKKLIPKQHYAKDAVLDEAIRTRFGDVLEATARCEQFAWRATTQGRLAEILVLDQFSRNVYRGTPRAFEQDALALVLAQELVASGQDRSLPLAQCCLHALYAQRVRVGRYPHRNAVLGRSSTAEELAFLTEPGSSF